MFERLLQLPVTSYQLLDDFGMAVLGRGPPGTGASDAVTDRIVLGKLLEFFQTVVDSPTSASNSLARYETPP